MGKAKIDHNGRIYTIFHTVERDTEGLYHEVKLVSGSRAIATGRTLPEAVASLKARIDEGYRPRQI